MADGSRNNLKFIGDEAPIGRIAPAPRTEIVRNLLTLGVFSNKKYADSAIRAGNFCIAACEQIINRGGNFAQAMYFINYFTRAVEIIQRQYPHIPDLPVTRRASV